MARHATAIEDKQARRAAILRAATGLFVAGDGTLPSAAEIAAAAGLAKGTVYLYFRTKEEIFASLLVTQEALALAPGRGVSLLMRTFALTRGLWQSSEPPSPEAAHAVAGLDVAAIYPDFRAELREALTEYWRGALACD